MIGLDHVHILPEGEQGLSAPALLLAFGARNRVVADELLLKGLLLFREPCVDSFVVFLASHGLAFRAWLWAAAGAQECADCEQAQDQLPDQLAPQNLKRSRSCIFTQ